MEFLEKDLEEIIYLSDKRKLSDRGLYLMGHLKKQLKIGNYGIADLVEIERPFYPKKSVNQIFGTTHFKGCINVIELKKDKIGVSTFFQALNYLTGIKTYLAQRGLEQLFNYKITLIGKDVDLNSSFCYLGDIFDNDLQCISIDSESLVSVKLYKYSYGIEGLEFHEISDYNLKVKGF
jgi:hypothetical protein